MPSTTGFDSFSSILNAVAQRLGLSPRLVEQRLAREWVEIVGDQIATHTRPEQIRSRRLSVLVDHSVWMQQLSFLKPDLLRRIRVHLGGEDVQDLVFRIGDLSRVPLTPPRPEPGIAPVGSQPSPALMREAASRTTSITDPALREQFTKVIAKALVAVQSASAGDR